MFDFHCFKICINLGEHFVNFYAPWCKHCQILEPVWTELAKSIPSDANVKISRVNCVKNEEACAAFEVKEYPLVAWISADKLVARYSGSRTLQKLKDFVRIQLLAIELGVHIIRLNQDIDETILRKLVKDKRRRIIALDDTNFNTFTQSGITFVHFTVPWSRHCLAVREQLRFLTAKITSEGYRVKVGVVDCSKNEDLCNENGVSILLFADASTQLNYNVYILDRWLPYVLPVQQWQTKQ